MTAVSPQRRQEVLDALRRGTVPRRGLDLLAVGLDRFEATLDQELGAAERGSGVFKALRGKYGSGKTFFARWLCERAKSRGFATAEAQISETETPLHRLETVYRRLIERLATAAHPSGALRGVVDAWFFTLEQDVLAEGTLDERDEAALLARSHELMEHRLADISRRAPAFAAALRGYRAALASGRRDVAEGLLAWIGGQPNVAAEVKRAARIKGAIDHFGALSFLEGLLVVLRDSGWETASLSFTLCQAQKRILLGEDPGVSLTRRARSQVEELRGCFPGLEADSTTLERVSTGRTRWWTFAGLKANATLADHLTASGFPVASRDNLSITFETPTGAIPLEEHLPAPTEAGALCPQSLALDALQSLKFAFCTPQALCLTTLTHRLADPEGTAAVAGMRVHGGSLCSPERPQAKNTNEAAPKRPL